MFEYDTNGVDVRPWFYAQPEAVKLMLWNRPYVHIRCRGVIETWVVDFTRSDGWNICKL